MKLEVISESPHSSDDIMQLKPIRYKIGEITMKIPMSSYRDSYNFDRAVKLLGIAAFVNEIGIPEEIHEQITEVYEGSPAMKLFEKGLGLPFYLLIFSSISDKAKTQEVLRLWGRKNPTKILPHIFDDDIPDLLLRHCLLQYLIANFEGTDLIKLFNHLIWLQFTIKKKALKFLQTNHLDKDHSKVVAPQSPTSRAAWESIQRKRLRKSRSRSSSR